MTLAFAGSGISIDIIFAIAEHLHPRKKKILITTTSHLYPPRMFTAPGRCLPFYLDAYCCLSGSPLDILSLLDSCGICIAGLPETAPASRTSLLSSQILPLPSRVYERVCPFADVVLVKTDSSRGLPLDYPAAQEPLIPSNADRILIVCDFSALGKPIGHVAERLIPALSCLNSLAPDSFHPPVTPDTPADASLILRLYAQGYLRPLRQKFPSKKVQLFPVLRPQNFSLLIPDFCDRIIKYWE